MTLPAERTALLRKVSFQLTSGMLLANLVGASVLFLFLLFVLPTAVPAADEDGLRELNLVIFVVYLALSGAAGQLWGNQVNRGLREWLRGQAEPTATLRLHVLRAPLRLAVVSASFWFGAAVLFGALNGFHSVALGVQVASTLLLGGATTTALCYLLAERILRPAVTLAQQGDVRAPPVVAGVTQRMVLTWMVGSGVPLFGIGLGYIRLPGEPPLTTTAGLFLVALGLGVGLALTVVAARAVADPIQSVAAALREVAEGRYDTVVPVYDASEVGQLQSGFNAMSQGLAERERLRDLFGRQVGPHVVQFGLDTGVRLGGERRDVAVLFVDVVGSTRLAVTREPEEVVRQLNDFFTVVVEAVARYGGWVNKFEGDAALCVFGAPTALEGARSSALAAARQIALGLLPLPLEAAIGVSAGPVVAGHVGAERRFEYTVIGDPVNVAARLAGLARDVPGRVLADDAVVRAAGPEQLNWQSWAEPVVLRGRTQATGLQRPNPPGG